MHKAYHVPYVYDYVTKSCRQQAEVIHNHENENIIGQGETQHRKYKRLKLGGGHVYNNKRQLSEENLKEKEKLVAGPKWAPDTKTDWPTACQS
jgi:hypothetical protein